MDLTGTYIEKVECAGPGFINFYLNRHWLYDALRLIQEKKEHYEELTWAKHPCNVEFVSANPTGPISYGNARRRFGHCIASVLKKAGYDVTREYYIMTRVTRLKFGISLEARYLQQLLERRKWLFPRRYHGRISSNTPRIISLSTAMRSLRDPRNVVKYSLSTLSHQY